METMTARSRASHRLMCTTTELAALILGCTATHPRCDLPSDADLDGRAADVSGTPTPVVEPRRFPWSDVQAEFLGLTDLDVPGGSDVDLRWRLQHPTTDPFLLTVTPVFSAEFAVPFDLVESASQRIADGTEFHARLRFVAPSGSWSVATGIGARLLRRAPTGDETWDLPQRVVTMTHSEVFPPSPREVTLDGRLEVELRGEPPVLHGPGGSWLLTAGVPYRLEHRAHNRTDVAADVRIVVASREVETDFGEERTVVIPARGSHDFSFVVRADAEGPCFACPSVLIGYVGEEPYVDGLLHSAHVVAD